MPTSYELRIEKKSILDNLKKKLYMCIWLYYSVSKMAFNVGHQQVLTMVLYLRNCYENQISITHCIWPLVLPTNFEMSSFYHNLI